MEENKTMETQEVNTERKELSYDELKNVATTEASIEDAEVNA